jgi:ribosomal protein S18 acetylase RimI-like enzyme
MSSQLKIRRAHSSDILASWKIMSECGQWLAKRGLNYWSHYFTKKKVEQILSQTETYLGYLNNQPIGIISLSSTPPHYYIADGYFNRFTNYQDKSLYLITIGTLPEQQGHGYASQLLEFAENAAKKADALWLRSDCRAEDKSLVRFYEMRGYKKVGEKPMSEGLQENYWLIEKKL